MPDTHGFNTELIPGLSSTHMASCGHFLVPNWNNLQYLLAARCIPKAQTGVWHTAEAPLSLLPLGNRCQQLRLSGTFCYKLLLTIAFIFAKLNRFG